MYLLLSELPNPLSHAQKFPHHARNSPKRTVIYSLSNVKARKSLKESALLAASIFFSWWVVKCPASTRMIIERTTAWLLNRFIVPPSHCNNIRASRLPSLQTKLLDLSVSLSGNLCAKNNILPPPLANHKLCEGDRISSISLKNVFSANWMRFDCSPLYALYPLINLKKSLMKNS